MGETSAEAREVTLLELVDRLLDRGVVLSGDITISVADVDLIVLGLRLLLTSAERLQQIGGTAGVALEEPTEAAHG
jgi:gas vesicle structural protein